MIHRSSTTRFIITIAAIAVITVLGTYAAIALLEGLAP